MYKIAICDDEEQTCVKLKQVLEKVQEDVGEQWEVGYFLSGALLLKQLENKNKYDFLFLDIHLRDLSGVGIGKYIREKQSDYRTLLIYISSDQSYAMELFQVQPYDFLIKPLTYEKVYKVIMRGVEQLRGSGYRLRYQKRKHMYQVFCEDILYLYSDRKKINIALTDGREEEFYGRLREIILQLPDCFTAISQSYVINRNYVKKYSYGEVVMMNQEILVISRARRKEVREIILKQKGKDRK